MIVPSRLLHPHALLVLTTWDMQTGLPGHIGSPHWYSAKAEADSSHAGVGSGLSSLPSLCATEMSDR